MSAVRLGTEPDTNYAVWVMWLDTPIAGSLARLIPFSCPECGALVRLNRVRGVIDAVAGAVDGSVSDSCAGCSARLHFDTTPEERRQSLRWLKVAVGLSQVSTSVDPVVAANIRRAVLGEA